MSPRAVMLLLAVACAMIIMEETEARVILPPDPNCDISAIWSCPCFPELASDTAIRPEDCLTRCIPECTCRDGYYKKDGVCVPYIKIGPVCGINERWSCPPCFPELNPDVAIKPAECWPECIPECICIDGYHKKDGVCVPITIEPNCGINERWSCPPCRPVMTSDIGIQPPECVSSCIPECICIDGYQRQNGVCVPYIPIDPFCGPNEIQTCRPCLFRRSSDLIRLPKECLLGVCIPECICRDGFYKQNGQCVPIIITDQPCGVNEIRRPCPACPISADIEKPSLCLTSCIPECICSDDYYKKDGVCVPSITV